MNLLAWQSIPEPELVPYGALAPLPVQSLLVLAPHADDEVFACGGLLALAVAQGLQIDVIVVSDGAAGGDSAVREAECHQAADVIGYVSRPEALQFWRLPDRGVIPDVALIARLRELLQQRRPQWLLAPSPFEVHPDHRAVCRAAIEAAAGSGAGLGFFEVGQALLPNVLIDISPVMPIKQRAMACFQSQLAIQRYDEQIAALNRFRAYTLGPSVTHAEALWFPAAEDCGSAAAVLAAVTRLIARRLGS